MATVTDIEMISPVVVDVQRHSSVSSVPSDEVIQSCIEATVRRTESDSKKAVEIAVRIVDEDEGRALNRRFRQQDQPTNVLSFPAGSNELPDELPQSLGDLVLCGPVVEREAAEQGKPAASHWQHMLVHGVLHLLGLDHQDTAEAQTMESLEIEILAQRGIADPYEIR